MADITSVCIASIVRFVYLLEVNIEDPTCKQFFLLHSQKPSAMLSN